MYAKIKNNKLTNHKKKLFLEQDQKIQVLQD